MSSHAFLFVYGSLKRGFHNHGRLESAQLIGEFHTNDAYVLLAGHGFPYLLKPEQMASVPALQVKGECYLIDASVLAATDDLEANGVFYQREEIAIRSHATGEVLHAWAYFLLDSHYVNEQSPPMFAKGLVDKTMNMYIWIAN